LLANPFNPRTTIKYDLPYSSEVTIEIYNFLGQKIRLLIDSQNQGPGYMQVIWDGRDDQGSQVASGIYMYRITISKATLDNQENETPFQQTQKMLFVK
jgi:flagellar hook assembly protein FlgD